MRFTRLVLAIVAVAVLALAVGSVAQASNMGFKMNRVIDALGIPAPKGQNLVALPIRNPYQNAQDVCVALNLAAGTGKVQQINAATGATLSHTCGAAGAFTLTQRVGVVVTNPVAAGGIIVGSHQPTATFTFNQLGLPAPKGRNDNPVLYHTTAVNAQDLCVDYGLPAGNGKIQRINAATGATLSHTCGAAGAFALVLGEATIVTFSGAGPITTTPGHPAHF